MAELGENPGAVLMYRICELSQAFNMLVSGNGELWTLANTMDIVNAGYLGEDQARAALSARSV